MLDLQIIPTTSAHNDGSKPAMHTCVIMLINQTATASTLDAVQVVYYLDSVESASCAR